MANEPRDKNMKRDQMVITGIAIGLLLGMICTTTLGDVVYTHDYQIECRILEHSTDVIVVETVAGEYIVIKKAQVGTIETEPKEEFFYRRAKFYEEKGFDHQALRDYLEVIQINEQHQPAKQGIEEIRYNRKKEQWDEGIKKAEQKYQGQEYWDALEEYKKVLNLQPDERVARRVVRKMSQIHADLAFLYYDHCADQEAIMQLAKAEELNPENAEIYYILARIHEYNGKTRLARLEYERALELDPNHGKARNNLMDLIERTRPS